MSVEADVHFSIIPEWVLDGASGNAVKLYGILARYADKGGKCHPSRKTLADRMGVSIRTVDAARSELVDMGAISVSRRPNGDTWLTSEITVRRIPPGGSADIALPSAADSRGVVQPAAHRTRASEREQELTLLRARPRDLLWDALVEIFGAAPAGIERGRWNKAVKSLKESGATPDALTRAAATYRTHPTFRDCALTPTALAANWTLLTVSQRETSELRVRSLEQRIAEREGGVA